MKIPGLDALTDPAGPLAKQAASAETLAAALDRSSRAQVVLAESNNRLAQAIEDSTRAAR